MGCQSVALHWFYIHESAKFRILSGLIQPLTETPHRVIGPIASHAKIALHLQRADRFVLKQQLLYPKDGVQNPKPAPQWRLRVFKECSCNMREPVLPASPAIQAFPFPLHIHGGPHAF